MKNLLLLLSALVLAGAAQAATVAWNAEITPTRTPTGGWCAKGSLVYMFDESVTSSDDIIASLSEGDTSILADSIATSFTTDGNGSLSMSGEAISSTNSSVLFGNDYGAIFVYFDSNSLASATKWLMGITGIKQTRANPVSFTEMQGVDEWQSLPVPEPATGALFLAGVALLARRRRRA